LVDKLGYSWDKIHDIAEQLEHIRSEEMIDRLDKFLGYPKLDPHGDPIPDASLNIKSQKQTLLSKFKKGEKGKVVGVKDSSSQLLRYLDTAGIQLGSLIEVKDVIEFDGSMVIQIDKKGKITISRLAAQNISIG